MFARKYLTTALLCLMLGAHGAYAAPVEEEAAVTLAPATALSEPTGTMSPAPADGAAGLIAQTRDSLSQTLEGALDLIGIRYRRGGSSPERGFDCSGFVNHVFREGLGLYLPRSAREMSKSGEPVTKNELQPGDLVFFNTMRRTFSHVGIYLGDNLFVHAPRTGGSIRVENLDARYWAKRFNGARRVVAE